MLIHNEGEGFFNTTEQNFLIININTELSLNGIVDENAGSNTDLIILSFPVCLEGDWNSIPSVSIDLPKSLSTSLDHSLSDEVGLLLQVRAKIMINKIHHRTTSKRPKLRNPDLLIAWIIESTIIEHMEHIHSWSGHNLLLEGQLDHI